MPKRLSCLSPQSFRRSFNWCGFKLFLWPMVSIELFKHMFTCHKDHTQHCSTYSIDVVSKWSCSHSYCFSWSNILHSNQAAAQQQEAAAGKQQAGTRGNQVPGSSRRRNDVKTTYEATLEPDPSHSRPRMGCTYPCCARRAFQPEDKPMGEGKASTQPARHDRSSQWHRWIQTTTMQIPK